MSSKKKLYEKIKNNPNGVGMSEIESVLLYLGFKKRQKGTSHCIFTHPNFNRIEHFINIPFNRPIKRIYIIKAIEIIDELELSDFL